ncbi:MAG: acyltransferase family protein [Marinosulfonomonas sp.]
MLELWCALSSMDSKVFGRFEHSKPATYLPLGKELTLVILLGDVSHNRDNNLNLIRVIAATLVLVSHAYPITQGVGAEEPLKATVGYSLGTISVYVFFVISGFLIAQSFERSGEIKKFLVARVLRLWPALIVSILLVVFVLGPLVTTLPTTDYLVDESTWAFLLRNVTLVSIQYELPGVFQDQPYPAIEGSIWTLIYEVACYLGVLLIGVLGFLRPSVKTTVLFACSLVALAALDVSGISLHKKIANLLELALPFGIGTAFYIWRVHIKLSLVIVLILSAAAWAAKGSMIFEPVFMVFLGYSVLWLAYVPGGKLRHYNQLGDYSYGIYIYAFPLQGMAVWIWGPMTPWANIALSLPLVLVPSVLSWHFIEKPSLALRGRF